MSIKKWHTFVHLWELDIKHANGDSSPFNSDESASDDGSPQKPMTPSTSISYDCTTPSNDSSPIKLYDNSPFKQIIKTPQTDIPIDRSRHISQDQSNLLPPPIDRTTKTQYNLRHQPQMDYRRFITPSKLQEKIIHSPGLMKTVIKT